MSVKSLERGHHNFVGSFNKSDVLHWESFAEHTSLRDGKFVLNKNKTLICLKIVEDFTVPKQMNTDLNWQSFWDNQRFMQYT